MQFLFQALAECGADYLTASRFLDGSSNFQRMCCFWRGHTPSANISCSFPTGSERIPDGTEQIGCPKMTPPPPWLGFENSCTNTLRICYWAHNTHVHAWYEGEPKPLLRLSTVVGYVKLGKLGPF